MYIVGLLFIVLEGGGAKTAALVLWKPLMLLALDLIIDLCKAAGDMPFDLPPPLFMPTPFGMATLLSSSAKNCQTSLFWS